MKLKTNALCLMISLVVALSGCQKKESEPAKAPPPPEVSVFTIEARDVPIYLEFVGQVYGFKDIAIRARVEGFLEGIHFEEGSEVKSGQLLYTLESQPFEANVAAMMSRVAEAKIMRAKAASDLSRIRPLAVRNAVSQSDLDAAVAEFEASEASVEAAEANLRAARIQLSYTKIQSPISGIIGRTLAKVGDFVGREPNPVILNTVSNIDTLRIQFFITENQYLQLARRIGELREQKQAPRGNAEREAQFELILADGSLYPHRGKFDFIDREVDPTTGAILIQTSFPNPDQLIRPGQFAKVRARGEVAKDAVLIPQRSVMELQGLHHVYVVNEQNVIEERRVEIGPTVKSMWLIRDGLKPGEKIVYEGLQKVSDGTVVSPKPATIDETDTGKR